MFNLIGIGLILVGGITSALIPNAVSFIVMFVGVFLFASIYYDDICIDYVIANSQDVLLRKKHYMNFIPISITAKIFTLGMVDFIFPIKTEYFKGVHNSEDDEYTYVKVSRKEYFDLRDKQRTIYTTQVLSEEFMKSSYSEDDLKFKKIKFQIIINVIVSFIMPYFGIPMLILLIPEYKDAKILQQAYDAAINKN